MPTETSSTALGMEQIAPDIHRLRLPLPFALNHVNCYLFRGQDGWTIVDTGLHTPQAEDHWRAALAELAIGRDHIVQIVLTHVHPDHYGMAGWLQAWTEGRAVVRMSRATEAAAQAIWQAPPEAWLEETGAYLRRNGLQASFLESVLASMRGMRAAVRPWPEKVQTFEPGAILHLGDRRVQAISAQGHADDQAVLYDADDRLLLCGDQVLMRITPNVGTWPTTPSNPLARFLRDLRGLRELDVRLALPGHRHLVEDFSGRVRELLHHHDVRLQATLDAVPPEGATTLDVARRVFPVDEYGVHEIRFAVAETLAHLEHLVDEGRASLTEDNGVWRFYPARP